ncbi:MAG: hypothetical protein Q8904_02255 [Bacteroidota bacterium]|nr:hypothetical protein [Bacteroidota bacterium]
MNNRSNRKGNIYLYNTNRRLIQEFQFDAKVITTLPVRLPAGTYLLKAFTLSYEPTTKLVIR